MIATIVIEHEGFLEWLLYDALGTLIYGALGIFVIPIMLLAIWEWRLRPACRRIFRRHTRGSRGMKRTMQ